MFRLRRPRRPRQLKILLFQNKGIHSLLWAGRGTVLGAQMQIYNMLILHDWSFGSLRSCAGFDLKTGCRQYGRQKLGSGGSGKRDRPEIRPGRGPLQLIENLPWVPESARPERRSVSKTARQTRASRLIGSVGSALQVPTLMIERLAMLPLRTGSPPYIT